MLFETKTAAWTWMRCNYTQALRLRHRVVSAHRDGKFVGFMPQLRPSDRKF